MPYLPSPFIFLLTNRQFFDIVILKKVKIMPKKIINTPDLENNPGDNHSVHLISALARSVGNIPFIINIIIELLRLLIDLLSSKDKDKKTSQKE